MGTKLKLVLPGSAMDRFARTTILDEDLAPIHQNTPGSLQTDIELEPGIYAARTVFTDGTQFQAAFQAKESDEVIEVRLKNISATRSRISVLENINSSSGPLSGFETIPDAAPAPNDSTDAVHDLGLAANNSSANIDVADPTQASLSISVVSLGPAGVTESTQPLPEASANVVQIERGEAGRFVKVDSGNEAADVFIAAPTSATEGVEIRFPSGDPTTFEVKLEDEHADLLLHYLENGRIVQISEIVGDYWPKVEALLDLGGERFSEFSSLVSKHLPLIDNLVGTGSTHLGRLAEALSSAGIQPFNAIASISILKEVTQLVLRYRPQVEALLEARRTKPVTATVAAYALLLVGPPLANDGARSHYGDLINLCSRFLFSGADNSPDELCICAELLARQGKHKEALELFLELPHRPPPMFSFGLRFALDRLTAYRNASQSGKLDENYAAMTEAALDDLNPLACQTDFTRPILTFRALAKSADAHVMAFE
ncbi:hypothetical protein [Rhizobium leguminosarum]|uniref:hypothetical protein n=1 Tax=Rhizobium leguminosarum TaxID=384 RepID=UPI003F960455